MLRLSKHRQGNKFIKKLFRNIQRFTPQADKIADIKNKTYHKPDIKNNIAGTYCFMDESIIKLYPCSCIDQQPQYRN